MAIPTAEQFEALSECFHRYHFEFFTRARRLEYPDQKSYLPSELTTLAGQLNDAHFECIALSRCPKSASAWDWLEASPAFQMACDALPLEPTPGFTNIFEQLFTQHYQRGFRSNPLSYDLEYRAGKYLRYISGIALACHNYLSGKSVRAALSGAETIARMNMLLTQLKQLSASDWISSRNQQALLNHLGRIDRCLNDHSLTNAAKPLSKRNDVDLASRLMAAEIIQLHTRLFDNPAKRAVFQLMGLPFVEKPLEMRTIERLIGAKQKRRINRPPKTPLDTNSADSGELLTTNSPATT